MNSFQICVHTREIQLRGQAVISVSFCKAAAQLLCTCTRGAAVLTLSTPSARCVAGVRGKRNLQSYIRNGVLLLLSTAYPVFKTVRSESVAQRKIYRVVNLPLFLTAF